MMCKFATEIISNNVEMGNNCTPTWVKTWTRFKLNNINIGFKWVNTVKV